MVEIKHNLLVRSQKLRSRIAYKLDIVKKERQEIDRMMKNYRKNDPALLSLINSIDKMAGMDEA